MDWSSYYQSSLPEPSNYRNEEQKAQKGNSEDNSEYPSMESQNQIRMWRIENQRLKRVNQKLYSKVCEHKSRQKELQKIIRELQKHKGRMLWEKENKGRKYRSLYPQFRLSDWNDQSFQNSLENYVMRDQKRNEQKWCEQEQSQIIGNIYIWNYEQISNKKRSLSFLQNKNEFSKYLILSQTQTEIL